MLDVKSAFVSAMQARVGCELEGACLTRVMGADKSYFELPC